MPQICTSHGIELRFTAISDHKTQMRKWLLHASRAMAPRLLTGGRVNMLLGTQPIEKADSAVIMAKRQSQRRDAD